MEGKLIGFRAVQEKDIPQICGFPQNKEELFFLSPKASFPLSNEAFEAIIAERHNPTVVTKKEKVVGFASLYKIEENNKCFIGNVIVSPSARGAGIGRALIDQMTKISVENYEIKEIHLSCFNNNIGGLLLYSKIGFIPYEIEERTNYNNEKVALIHMKRKAT